MGFCIPHDYRGIFLAKQLNSILLIAQQASDHRHRSAAALHEHGCDRQAEDYVAAFLQPEVWTDTASANHRCLRTGPTRSSLCHLQHRQLWARLAGARLAWARTEHSSGGATAQERSSNASAGSSKLHVWGAENTAVLSSVLGMLARINTMDWMKPAQCRELPGLSRSLRIHSECWDVHHLHSSVTTGYAAIGVCNCTLMKLWWLSFSSDSTKPLQFLCLETAFIISSIQLNHVSV